MDRFAWGRKYSGVMLLIAAAVLLANLRIIPTAAPTYDVVWDYLVPIAIPLLLFQANLKRIIRESGPTLIGFVIGSAGVVAGVVIGVTLLDLGSAEAELGGIFTGTYIGGSLNFAAVAEASQLQDGSILAAAVAAVITGTMFLFWPLAQIMDPPLSWTFAGLALHGRHFRGFQSGLLHSRDVIYYLAVTYFFLLAAVKVMEAKRWE